MNLLLPISCYRKENETRQKINPISSNYYSYSSRAFHFKPSLLLSFHCIIIVVTVIKTGNFLIISHNIIILWWKWAISRPWWDLLKCQMQFINQDFKFKWKNGAILITKKVITSGWSTESSVNVIVVITFFSGVISVDYRDMNTFYEERVIFLSLEKLVKALFKLSGMSFLPHTSNALRVSQFSFTGKISTH